VPSSDTFCYNVSVSRFRESSCHIPCSIRALGRQVHRSASICMQTDRQSAMRFNYVVDISRTGRNVSRVSILSWHCIFRYSWPDYRLYCRSIELHYAAIIFQGEQ
jgi:hypothetical protein